MTTRKTEKELVVEFDLNEKEAELLLEVLTPHRSMEYHAICSKEPEMSVLERSTISGQARRALLEFKRLLKQAPSKVRMAVQAYIESCLPPDQSD